MSELIYMSNEEKEEEKASYVEKKTTKLDDKSNYVNKIIRFFHLRIWSETLGVSGNLSPSQDEEWKLRRGAICANS